MEKIIPLDVECSNTIEYVKFLLEDTVGIPPDKMFLLFHGKQLQDGMTLTDYGIQTDSTLHFIQKPPFHGKEI